MFFPKLRLNRLFIIVAILVGFSTPSMAATVLGSITHDYGSGPGGYDPGGSETLTPTGVMLSDAIASGDRFNDYFDFSWITGTITAIKVTLAFEGAGPSGCIIGELCLTERWQARIQGSNSSGEGDDYFGTLFDVLSPQDFWLSAATDTGTINAFAHSVASGGLGLWFSEQTGNTPADVAHLLWATVEVTGEQLVSAVPLPAGILLLGAALAGLGIVGTKRRYAA